jgi:hypothetical protein
MNVIRFPTHLISTLEISEAVDWPHAELMRDARATAAVPGRPNGFGWSTTGAKTGQYKARTT